MGLSANSVYLSLWGILGSAGGLVVPYLLPLLVRSVVLAAVAPLSIG